MWDGIEAAGAKLLSGIEEAATAAGVPLVANRVGTMFGFFFSKQPVTNWETAKKADVDRFAAYFRAMLANGIYVAPSQFEVGFLSAAHGDEEIEATIDAATQTFNTL
jgi:glutamate-1-semialdehyde 2,1-aminomutase